MRQQAADDPSGEHEGRPETSVNVDEGLARAYPGASRMFMHRRGPCWRMIGLGRRVLILVSIVVSVTDLIAYYRVQYGHSDLTLVFILGIIFITIVPIAVG